MIDAGIEIKGLVIKSGSKMVACTEFYTTILIMSIIPSFPDAERKKEPLGLTINERS